MPDDDEASGSSAARQTLAERYGTERPGRRRWLVAGVAGLAAVLLGWLLWAAWVHSTPSVQGGLRSYDVVSPHRVSVVIDVRREGPDSVECEVRALAVDHSTVGVEVVRIPAGESGDVRFETSITTAREATAVLVSDCR